MSLKRENSFVAVCFVEGPGAGIALGDFGSGGSHGGEGGCADGSQVAPSGYGNFLIPSHFGSGGASGTHTGSTYAGMCVCFCGGCGTFGLHALK